MVLIAMAQFSPVVFCFRNMTIGERGNQRLIGTVRREFLDRLFFWNGRDLSLKLELFRRYYIVHRVHQSLAGATPAEQGGCPSQPSASLGHYRWQSHCQELFQLPIAA